VIAFVLQGNRMFIGLGLTKNNVERLQKNRPLIVTGEDVGLGKIDIVIFHGQDEASLLKQMNNAGIELPE